MRSHDATAAPVLLGIEAGGTRTTARAERSSGEVLAERVFAPGNVRLLDDVALVRLFREIAVAMPAPAALGLGLAGLRTEADRRRVLGALEAVWPGTPARVAHDLEAALRAADPPGNQRTRSTPDVRVLVLSGTGSCCYGTNAARDRTAKIGGWGHILGDKGSGHDIALRALKAAVFYLDRNGRWSRLGERLLGAAGLNSPEDLVGWVQTADKAAVAALAPQVFAAWAERDRIAADIVAAAAAGLAKDAVACARRLARPGRRPVDFVLAGGVLLGQPRFAARVGRQLRAMWKGAAVVRPLTVPGVVGAVRMAREAGVEGGWEAARPKAAECRPPHAMQPPPPLAGVHRSPTEQRNPRSMNLDRLALDAAITLMLGEEAGVPTALERERRAIVRALRIIIRALKGGGRLFYAGAGTSGRLGVLDASECPPTFRTPPELVQAIMAGGRDAVFRAVEGAEDDVAAGAAAVRFRGVRRGDVLVGIAASGRTPFVWGALDAARVGGAATVLLCFNPHVAIPRGRRPDVVIAADLGPEVLTGSTRLKAGTATKLVLNLFSTLAMVRLGKVASNLMVDLNPSNAKLRDRAVRIVRELSGVDDAAARDALEAEGWVVKSAWRRLGRRGGSGD
ncbi:MAG: N-acetylmuramic acid 6-phosphate etherase [Limisphaerales bacterium]